MGNRESWPDENADSTCCLHGVNLDPLPVEVFCPARTKPSWFRLVQQHSDSAYGFTLVEAMISMVILLIACLVLFQGMELTILQYTSSQRRWETILERWNDTELLRSTPPRDTEPIWIMPNARPLYRDLLATGEPTAWEVLRAEK